METGILRCLLVNALLTLRNISPSDTVISFVFLLGVLGVLAQDPGWLRILFVLVWYGLVWYSFVCVWFMIHTCFVSDGLTDTARNWPVTKLPLKRLVKNRATGELSVRFVTCLH